MGQGNIFRNIYNFFVMIRYRTNPDWDGPVPPVPCQFCGGTDHDEKSCPNYEAKGFAEYFSSK